MRELRERSGPALKIICLVLVVLALHQLAGIFIRWNPFRGVVVPQLPSLAVATNSPAASGPGTNLVTQITVKQTNGTPRLAGTNAGLSVVGGNTNSVLVSTNSTQGTNSIAPSELPDETNLTVRLEAKVNGTNFTSTTNAVNQETNHLVATTVAETNAMAGSNAATKITNVPPALKMAGMNFNPFQPQGKRGGDLSPVVQARIDRIIESEILGPIVHPLPMALMGIAGNVAFLRSANGQTGMVKEGDSLGDIKLLRIGINRVLIEQDGQKKELTIFSGYGSDSLLPKEIPNENKHP
jgi:hypothetical protein